MNEKAFALLAALMMISVAGIAMVNNADETPALSAPTGAYKVYYYGGDAVTGYEWKVEEAATYDLFQAIQETSQALGFTYTADTSKIWGTGYDINPSPTYGTIYTINNSSDFTIFVYDNRDTVGSLQWETAQPALGWYRCFADYAGSVCFPSPTNTFGATAGAANVAIVPADVDSMPDATKTGAALQPMNMQALTTVTTDSQYEYAFHIADSTGTAIVAAGTYATYYNERTSTWVYDEINEGMLYSSIHYDSQAGRMVADDGLIVRGYGSDVYQAFKNAIGLANISVQLITWIYHDNDTIDTADDYYTYYSWYTTIFGQGTVGPIHGTDQGGSYTKYIYWEAYTAGNQYLSFCPGFYSKLNGAIGLADSGYDYTYLSSKYYDSTS